MKYLMSAEWWKAAGIRAAKTMFQTGAITPIAAEPSGPWYCPTMTISTRPNTLPMNALPKAAARYFR